MKGFWKKAEHAAHYLAAGLAAIHLSVLVPAHTVELFGHIIGKGH